MSVSYKVLESGDVVDIRRAPAIGLRLWRVRVCEQWPKYVTRASAYLTEQELLDLARACIDMIARARQG